MSIPSHPVPTIDSMNQKKFTPKTGATLRATPKTSVAPNEPPLLHETIINVDDSEENKKKKTKTDEDGEYAIITIESQSQHVHPARPLFLDDEPILKTPIATK